MSYGDFYFFIHAEKPFIHPQKRGRIPMRFDLFIYSAYIFRSIPVHFPAAY